MISTIKGTARLIAKEQLTQGSRKDRKAAEARLRSSLKKAFKEGRDINDNLVRK
jgi:hypothetical protein